MLKLPVLLTLLCVAFGCSVKPNDKELKGIIMRYNQLLADGFLNLNMTQLQEVATPEQAQKEYYLMAALGEGKLKMQSQLKKIDFLGTEFTAQGEAVVKTHEKWDYTHIDINTGKKVKEQKDVLYDLSYRLKRDGEHWLVSEITETGKTEPNAVTTPQLQVSSASMHRH